MIPKFHLILFILIPSFAFGQSKKPSPFNPTGTYKFDEKVEIKDGETYGYFGEINVKSLNHSRIAITLWICKGAPSYNSGSAWDTLLVKDRVATYIPADDSSCTITFTLQNKKIIVKQVQRNLNFGCGFGQGVFADGEYLKVSNKVPMITDPEVENRANE